MARTKANKKTSARGAAVAAREQAFERCADDPHLEPVLRLARDLIEEGLQSEAVARVAGSVFYACAAKETIGTETADDARDLLRALRHLGLDGDAAADLVADVFSRRVPPS